MLLLASVLVSPLEKRVNYTSAATSWASGETPLRTPRRMNSAKQHNGVGIFLRESRNAFHFVNAKAQSLRPTQCSKDL